MNVEAYQWSGHSWGADAARLAAELERDASPAIVAKALALATAVDEAVHYGTLASCDAVVDQVLAHFPGIAAAWRVVEVYVAGSAPPCYKDGERCALPPLRFYPEAAAEQPA
jgi:hypothetical protein